ncbi:hypothetical protein LCGC14_2967480 [marine sediment metagenome]|uniref:DUF7352 domain-containing protein n=1 Tax=marine sediment metagenome TaxID=412755 RepID=A0A0F8XXU2_9ZZZZ
MLTIWKYNLEIQNDNPILMQWKDIYEISMPVYSEFLSVGTQHNKPVMWFKVETQTDRITRKFIIVGTGRKVEPISAKYLGTFLLNEGYFVGHVFELIFS